MNLRPLLAAAMTAAMTATLAAGTTVAATAASAAPTAAAASSVPVWHVAECNRYLGTDYTAAQLTLAKTTSQTLTTSAGYKLTLRTDSYQLPDPNARCEFLSATSPDVTAKKIGFRVAGAYEQVVDTYVNGSVVKSSVGMEGDFVHPVMYGEPDGLTVLAADASTGDYTGVVGDSEWSPVSEPVGATWRQHARPLTFDVDITVLKIVWTTNPASPEAIAAAGKARDSAIKKANSTYNAAVKKALKAKRAGLKNATTNAAKAKVNAKYTKAVKKAASAKAAAVKAAKDTYASAIVVRSGKYEATDEVLHATGSIAR